jgi:hypothetical protein
MESAATLGLIGSGVRVDLAAVNRRVLGPPRRSPAKRTLAANGCA